jgi:AAA15 family ATPase/GTPase
LELFYYWSLNFSQYSFVFIDEFDAFYHYELSAAVVKKLNERTNFQSFLTTHNTTLMNNDLMRPDCLFIIEDNKISNVAERTQKELREGHNLEKIYRSNGFDAR